MLQRLNRIAQMIPPNLKVIADIGCDHGLLGKILLESNKCDKIIACDISHGSLNKCRELAEKLALNIETRLADGMLAIKADEVDFAVIAGMGGREIIHILSDERRLDGIIDFIVSPQSDLSYFRASLKKLGLSVVQEEMVKEGKHFYFLIRLKKMENCIENSLAPICDDNENNVIGDEMNFTDEQLQFGMFASKNPYDFVSAESMEVFNEYLKFNISVLENKILLHGRRCELLDEMDKYMLLLNKLL